MIIDLSRAHVWDASAVAALDAIETHDARHGVAVEITGLDRRSEQLHTELSGQLAGAHSAGARRARDTSSRRPVAGAGGAGSPG